MMKSISRFRLPLGGVPGGGGGLLDAGLAERVPGVGRVGAEGLESALAVTINILFPNTIHQQLIYY